MSGNGVGYKDNLDPELTEMNLAKYKADGLYKNIWHCRIGRIRLHSKERRKALAMRNDPKTSRVWFI